MSGDVYEQLADALDRLPNGYPRTESGVEIAILKRIFTPEEAALAERLSAEMESAEAVAARAGVPAEEVGRGLSDMARRGLVWFAKRDGEARFRLAPFIVGVYEAQVGVLDEELARLVEQYLHEGGAEGIMAPQPALHRVVPAEGSVEAEWILPYDDVREVMLAAKTFSARECICRVQQDKLGHSCEFPVSVCLSFTAAERAPRPGDISREEALALLEETEEVGLVHTVSNVTEGVGYVCNCCGCCCGILRGITDFGIEDSVAHANYYAVIDADLCAGCGTCIERCQVEAILEENGVSVVVREKCIGCGLCVSGCPDEVAMLVRKPDSEVVHPPTDFRAWEQQRSAGRGLLPT
jgi:NAD-dependent dihydropyrimidine dehydrogenase PreA subunit